MTDVVKLGGSLLENRVLRRATLEAIATAWTSGRRSIVVHGGGKRIDAMLAALDIPKKVQGGLRVTDAETLDVVAGALARHRRPEALTVLRALPRRVPAWMSGAVTGAIAMLRDDRPSDALTSDWRLRYRRLPSLGWGLPPSWIQVAALARDQRRAANGQMASAMLAARRYSERSNRRCRRCDGDVWEPVGLPVCAHTASAVLQLQAGIVRQWCDDGRYDVWTALDACDGADLARAASPATTSDVSSMIGMVAIARATLYWMVSVGLEDLRAGGRHVRCVVRDIQVLYEPHQPRVTPKRSAAPFRYTRTPAAPLPQSLS